MGHALSYAFFNCTDNFRWGPWFDHVMSAWKIREEENVLFLFFEDVKRVRGPTHNLFMYATS